MKYNPDMHHRRSIRLKDYDYSRPGAYFITICTHNRECVFGEITVGKMTFNEFGKIANQFWVDIGNRFPNVELDEFVIMPNHVHGILVFTASVGAGFTPARASAGRATTGRATAGRATTGRATAGRATTGRATAGRATAGRATTGRATTGRATTGRATTGRATVGRATARVAPTLGQIVGAYKSVVSNECLKIYKSKNLYLGKLWQRNYYEHIIRDQNDLNRIRKYIMENPLKWREDKYFV